jgi:hypothetical protein
MYNYSLSGLTRNVSYKPKEGILKNKQVIEKSIPQKSKYMCIDHFYNDRIDHFYNDSIAHRIHDNFYVFPLLKEKKNPISIDFLFKEKKPVYNIILKYILEYEQILKKEQEQEQEQEQEKKQERKHKRYEMYLRKQQRKQQRNRKFNQKHIYVKPRAKILVRE